MNRTHVIILLMVLIISLCISVCMAIKETLNDKGKNYVRKIECMFNSKPITTVIFDRNLNFFDIEKRELNYNVNITFPNKLKPTNLKGILSFQEKLTLQSGHVYISTDKSKPLLKTFDHKSTAATMSSSIKSENGTVANIMFNKLSLDKDSEVRLTFFF